MKHTQLIETILYVNYQNTSAKLYSELFWTSPDLNVPGITEFHVAENCKSGLIPNKGIANNTPYPGQENGIPGCELYFYVENTQLEFNNAICAILISQIEDKNRSDNVCYFSDLDRHIITFTERKF